MTAASRSLTLTVLPDRFSILRFAPDVPVPSWAIVGDFFSLTRTKEELSIVCQKSSVPPTEINEKEWRALKVHGPFEFNEIGVLASLTTPLAEAQIGIFVLSTFDTDYLLVQSGDLQRTFVTLQAAGHTVRQDNLVARS